MHTRSVAAAARGLSAAATLALAVAAASAAEPVFVENASEAGGGVDELFWLATWSGAVAFVLILAILAYSIVAFRARPGHRAAYLTGEGRGARVFTSVFALVVFVALDVNLAVKDHEVYDAMYGHPPAEGEAMVVEVLARQFEWNFRYAGDDGEFGTADDWRTVQTLRVPSDRPTVLRMKSIDVIHSFFLPNFRTKQDVVPGMFTSMVLRPAREGTFDVACAELCGMGHHEMRGILQVLPREEFERWGAEQRAEIAEYGPDPDGEESWAKWTARSAR